MQRHTDSDDATIDVADLLDTPDGRDELGTPDEHIDRCPECDTLYRSGGEHRCSNGEWVVR